jgi:preprotein translocase subunit SecD
MYRISRLRLALIILVFIFSSLYLLPTIPGVYGRLFGYFDVWMQSKIPKPDIQSGKNGEFIRFIIPEVDLPKGTSIQEASQAIQDIVDRRLYNLGIRESSEYGSPFTFQYVPTTDLYLRFTQTKSKSDLKGIIGKIQLDGNPTPLNRSPELPTGENKGSIKFSIPRGINPDGTDFKDYVDKAKTKIKDQLVAAGIPSEQFRFQESAGGELQLSFISARDKAQLQSLLGSMRLYGSLPASLRPVFPDNPLKQGLDLKGGLHIVLELDVKKAMDIYLSDQAKESILSALKNEKIFSKSVLKSLEKVGDYSFILRGYAPEGSSVTDAQILADMKEKLRKIGFTDENISISSSEFPELTVKTNSDMDIGYLVDNLLGGNNQLIVSITVPARFQGADRDEYIKAAERVLDKLELFESPRRLRAKGDLVMFSIQLSQNSAEKLAEDNIGTVMKTLENRINKFGLAESTIRRVRGRPRILIEIPEEQNPTRTLAAIKSPGVLQFKLVKTNPVGGGIWNGGPDTPQPAPDELPPGTEIRNHIDGGWYVLDSTAFMHGTDLKSNSAMVTSGEFGSPEVIMFLTTEGQRKFTDFTGKHVNECTAILLDDIIQSAPRIQEKISSKSARISGTFTAEEADYLAKILKAGSFPAPMKSAEERIVGPTLGKESIDRGKIAFIIGTSLVIIFTIFYYKWSGTIAVAALIFQFLIILGVLSGFGATLTLPGLAGLILTIGMSVDANVLIFERIREELRAGKTIRSAIDSGYQRAFWVILDSNLTTIITAIVLYEFGTGPIKGFAVTLAVGILVNMFTAIVVTREIYRWTYYRRRVLNKLSI